MSKKGSEHSLWQYIRIGMQHAGDMVRIEAPEQGAGAPDVNYCLRGVEGNVELKYCDEQRNGFEVRATQYRWFQRRMEAGGNGWILAEYEGGDSHWFAVIHGSEIRELTESAKPAIWRNKASVVWEDRIDFEELIGILSNHRVRIEYVDRDTRQEV